MSERSLNMVSLTYAYKAKNVLVEHGIHASIVNAPKPGSAECGYAIVVSGNRQAAYAILQQNHIAVV